MSLRTLRVLRVFGRVFEREYCVKGGFDVECPLPARISVPLENEGYRVKSFWLVAQGAGVVN